MRIKTSELTGHALDWVVAKCEAYPMDIWYDEEELPMIRDDEVPEWKPATDWAQGGPIIEREVLDVFRNYSEGCWQAEANRYGGCPMGRGPTPLIAAMRCYVASELGDEVEIPESLV